jgi:hypothetical protein
MTLRADISFLLSIHKSEREDINGENHLSRGVGNRLASQKAQRLPRKLKFRYFVRFQVFTVGTTKNAVFWDVIPCGSLRTDVSEERSDPIIRVNRLRVLGIILRSVRRLLVLLTFFLAHRLLSLWWWRRCVPPKRRFVQEPYGVTSKKTAFFIFIIMFTGGRCRNLSWGRWYIQLIHSHSTPSLLRLWNYLSHSGFSLSHVFIYCLPRTRYSFLHFTHPDLIILLSKLSLSTLLSNIFNI